MKWIIGLFATVSALLAGNNGNTPQQPVELNTAVIAYNQTYYAPVVADPGNFPWAKKVSVSASEGSQKSTAKKEAPAPAPVIIPTPPPPPPQPIGDPYLSTTEPITSWLKMDVTLAGDGFEGTREFASIKFDREYWKIEYESYWISPPTQKVPVENDYFKLEVYEKGTNKLVFSTASGKEEGFRGHQAFHKPGEYYFKTYTKPVSKYEVSLFVSPKLAQ